VKLPVATSVLPSGETAMVVALSRASSECSVPFTQWNAPAM
jgi:hypothetical protein